MKISPLKNTVFSRMSLIWLVILSASTFTELLAEDDLHERTLLFREARLLSDSNEFIIAGGDYRAGKIVLSQLSDSYDNNNAKWMLKAVEQRFNLLREVEIASPSKRGSIAKGFQCLQQAVERYNEYNYREAVEYLCLSYNLLHENTGHIQEESLICLDVLTAINSVAGKEEIAIELAGYSATLAKELYGETNPLYASRLRMLGIANLRAKKFDQAELLFLQVADVYQQCTGRFAYLQKSSLNNLAELYFVKGDLQKSKEFLDSSMRMYSIDSNTKFRSETLRSQALLGMYWYSVGDASKAIEEFERAISKMDSLPGVLPIQTQIDVLKAYSDSVLRTGREQNLFETHSRIHRLTELKKEISATVQPVGIANGRVVAKAQW